MSKPLQEGTDIVNLVDYSDYFAAPIGTKLKIINLGSTCFEAISPGGPYLYFLRDEEGQAWKRSKKKIG